MMKTTEDAQQQRARAEARNARIRELTLAVAEGWYDVPDELLAAAILKSTGTEFFTETEPRSPAAR